MKASKAVQLILSEIVVRGSEADFEADEVQDTIETMNMYMAQLAAKGVNLGYTRVSDLGDTITVPDGALMGLIANTAVMMAPTFGVTVSRELATKAVSGLNAMKHLGVSTSYTAYPTTLPRGSGNYEGTYTDQFFYDDHEGDILTESGGAIGLETST